MVYVLLKELFTLNAGFQKTYRHRRLMCHAYYRHGTEMTEITVEVTQKILHLALAIAWFWCHNMCCKDRACIHCFVEVGLACETRRDHRL